MGIQETLKALSDPVRRQILEHLKRGRMPAGQIAELFDISAPAVSRHLSPGSCATTARESSCSTS